VRLQNLKTSGDSAGEAQLLSHLQHLQQLTHLDMYSSLKNVVEVELEDDDWDNLEGTPSMKTNPPAARMRL
jgi:hypothetical protein